MNHLSRIGWTAAALLVGLAGCGGGGGPTVTAQTGTIEGSVTADGSGVPGVSVGLSSGGVRETNATGGFRFDNVPVGNHTLTMDLPSGYELGDGEALAKPVTVTAGATASVAWALRTAELPREVDIQMESSSFTPSNVSLALGGTATWTNARAVPHTITPANPNQAGVWANQSVPAEQGWTFSHTFNTAGTYNYSCQIHAGMTGTIQVR